jgi:toxin FitB
MNGEESYLLDTNVVIDFLKNQNKALEFILSHPDSSFAISQITRIEILSHDSLTNEAEKKIKAFLDKLTVIPITSAVERQTIALRRVKKIKIPDAVIVSSAMVFGRTLLTRDKQLINLEIQNLKIINPEQ